MTNQDKQIERQLQNYNNILLYKQDLYKYYKKYKNTLNSIYISTPKKGKTAIENILHQTDNTSQTKNKTISKLIEEIITNTKDNKLYIFLDHLEQLSLRELEYYQELKQAKNIHIIANIQQDKQIVDENFIKNFIIINQSEYNQNRTQSINVTYTILLILSVIVFLAFIRTRLSLVGYLVSALWFTLLMYRSFSYIAH